VCDAGKANDMAACELDRSLVLDEIGGLELGVGDRGVEIPEGFLAYGALDPFEVFELLAAKLPDGVEAGPRTLGGLLLLVAFRDDYGVGLLV
jgi:hypothetical protein